MGVQYYPWISLRMHRRATASLPPVALRAELGVVAGEAILVRLAGHILMSAAEEVG